MIDSFEQPLADDALERLDLLRDGRLGVSQRDCGAAEAAFAGDRFERGEVTELDPEPSISFHDRNEE